MKTILTLAFRPVSRSRSEVLGPLAGFVVLLNLPPVRARADSLCFDPYVCLSFAHACEGYPYKEYFISVAAGGYTIDPSGPCPFSSEGSWFRLSESSTDPWINTGSPGTYPSELYLWFMGYNQPHWHLGGGQMCFSGEIDIASVEPIGTWETEYFEPIRFLDLSWTGGNCTVTSPIPVARLNIDSAVHVDLSSWGSIKALYR